MKLSVVSSLYRSAPYIQKFCEQVDLAVSQIPEIGNAYEIILVNDGSPDNSLYLANELAIKNHKIRIIDLSRNFGHHKAIFTGLGYAQGDFIFIIDSDLEEDPSMLVKFWQHLQADNGPDLVFGVQVQRKGDLMERISGKWFFILFNFIAEHKIIPNQITARLMTKRYLRDLMRFRESEIVLVGVSDLAGYKQMPIAVEKASKGKSVYSFSKRLKMAVDMITSLSSRPAEYVFYLGLLIFVISICAVVYCISPLLFYGRALQGWTSLAMSIWFLGGLIILCQGIIGLYIARIYQQVKNRPFTIVRSDSADTHQAYDTSKF